MNILWRCDVDGLFCDEKRGEIFITVDDLESTDFNHKNRGRNERKAFAKLIVPSSRCVCNAVTELRVGIDLLYGSHQPAGR